MQTRDLHIQCARCAILDHEVSEAHGCSELFWHPPRNATCKSPLGRARLPFRSGERANRSCMVISSTPANETDPLIGAMLGKDYRVLERIGIGGMAVVYLVEHQTLLKRFAAKVLSTELASSLEARARFTQEAHAASQLDHENIVSISDFGATVDQRPFFVMELLRGQTLDQRLGDGAMSVEEVVAVSVPVARALAHAHAEGVVHRDVKPENIFLVQRSQGRWTVKVVDFGIAKTPVNPKLTQTKPKLGETFGSPLFMAPEMIRGEDDVDPRADVYSFGVLLYLMLCGRLPFDDENLLKVMQMHLSVPPPPPRTINPALSEELAAVVERALAKPPADRYASMEALLLDLEAALPAGSDRLLIEAQSGTALQDTPFAAALSLTRLETQRPRTASVPPPVSAALPVAPRRSRALLVLAIAAVALALTGAVGWRRITGRLSAVAAVADSPADTAASPVAAIEPAAALRAVAEPPQPVPLPPGDPPVAADEPAPEPDPAVDPAVDPAAAPEPAPEPAPTPAPPTARPVPGRAVAVAPARPVTRRPPPRAIQRAAAGPRTPAAARVAVAPAGSDAATASDAPAAADPAGAAPPAAAGPEVATVPGRTAPSEAAPPGAPSSPTVPPAAPAITAPPGPEPAPAPVLAKPAPAAPVKPAPAAPPTGSFDATPEVASLDVIGSLSSSIVRRSLDRTLPALRACYGAAARASRVTPAVDLQLSYELDETGAATHVATGGTQLGSLARCAAGLASQLRTREAPDIGTVKVVVVIHFRPS